MGWSLLQMIDPVNLTEYQPAPELGLVARERVFSAVPRDDVLRHQRQLLQLNHLEKEKKRH